MIKLGITGGIGSGKSIVSTLLEVVGIPVYIADIESKKLTETSPLIREKLIRLFDNEIYINGTLDKKRLASYIFQNRNYLEQVNAIIHPVVNRHFLDWVDQQYTSVCAIETAILFESGFDKDINMSVMVYAPLDVRIKRTITRDNVTREEVLRRINNQLSDEIKKDRADYIIYNDDIRPVIPQVGCLLQKLS